MRLVTLRSADALCIGVVVGDEVVDLRAHEPALPRDMGGFLALGAAGLDVAKRAAASAAPRHPLDARRLAAPVAAPGKVFGIGMNFRSFRDAATRRGMVPPPGQRVWFNRQRNCVGGPADDIWMPRASSALDYEGELALVIGMRCRHLTAAQAPTVVAGYTICNDLTVRDWAARCPLLGKSFDTHAPMGPWLVTADELGDPHALGITTEVNGERRQHGSTSEMLTNCYELVAELSAITTLEPGDVILTGTPAGCAVLESPDRYLRPGDRVRIAIDGIGAIDNAVVAESTAESTAEEVAG